MNVVFFSGIKFAAGLGGFSVNNFSRHRHKAESATLSLCQPDFIFVIGTFSSKQRAGIYTILMYTLDQTLLKKSRLFKLH